MIAKVGVKNPTQPRLWGKLAIPTSGNTSRYLIGVNKPDICWKGIFKYSKLCDTEIVFLR